MLSSGRFLELLHRLRTTEIVVTTMASVRPWGRLSASEYDLASADSAMGHAADLALGIALAQPHRTVMCLNGDGSMLMTLGTLATIVGSGARNLILVVMHNGSYEITGKQPIPGQGLLDFASIARGAGFERVYRCDTEHQCEQILSDVLHGEGPAFVSVTVDGGNEGPISRGPAESAAYLQISLAESARRLRSALARKP